MSNYQVGRLIRDYKFTKEKFANARTTDLPNGAGLDAFYKAMAPLRVDFLQIMQEDPTLETMSAYQIRMMLRINLSERWIDLYRFGLQIEIV